MSHFCVALVTGAGSGIGKAVAERLARENVTVGVLGRSESELRETFNKIVADGGKAIVLVADISDEKQMRRAVQQLVDETGRLDIVVANAGINGVWAPLTTCNLPSGIRQFARHLSYAAPDRAAPQRMRRRSRRAMSP